MRCIVIGGGAAGFFGAIQCKTENPDGEVILLEKSQKTLAKVRISGGGRCNVTHACFEPKKLAEHYPRGSKELIGPFHEWQPKDMIAWFQERGVTLKREADGRMFPVTDNSETIASCLEETVRKLGIELKTGTGVKGVTKTENHFELKLSTGETLRCDRLLIATGGNQAFGGHAMAASLGHTIQELVPSLFTFHIKDPRIEGLQGISVPKARVWVPEAKLESEGPLLITHWGMSGPAILKLSAWGARKLHALDYTFELKVNWLGEGTTQKVLETLQQNKQAQARKQLSSTLLFNLPQRLWDRLLFAANIPEKLKWADISKKQLQALASELCEGSYPVKGKSLFKEEFVTCGGVALKEVNFKTMESKCCPGLFFAGEVLDIDGITGGFNFQAAWTTATLAGRAIAAG
ncbi:MAG TPA: aminoacetone oxidase family FAD-binding enzyme [Opitutae bacterium]|nr:aminoacetone oxidase family FAD-binding enzyme [Opitutae bacterium]